MSRIARHRQRAAENDDARLLEEMIVAGRGSGGQLQGARIWTLVFADDRPIGVTLHLTADRWVPLPISDPRAQAIIEHFLRDEGVAP